MDTLSGMETYLWVALGIALSVLIPIVKAALPVATPRAEPVDVWPFVRKYGVIGIFSLLVAILIVAFSKEAIDDKWGLAVIAGYAWDSTLQKISGPPAA